MCLSGYRQVVRQYRSARSSLFWHFGSVSSCHWYISAGCTAIKEARAGNTQSIHLRYLDVSHDSHGIFESLNSSFWQASCLSRSSSSSKFMFLMAFCQTEMFSVMPTSFHALFTWASSSVLAKCQPLAHSFNSLRRFVLGFPVK